MVLTCEFCVEPRLVRVDLKNLEFFNGMLLHSCVAMVMHLVSLGHSVQTVVTRSSNLIVFDRQWTTYYYLIIQPELLNLTVFSYGSILRI